MITTKNRECLSGWRKKKERLLENPAALIVLAPTHEKGGVPASWGEVLSFAKTKALCTQGL